MPLIFSRRKRNGNKFTNKPGEKTGYFSFTNSGRWKARPMSRAKWITAARAEATVKDVLIHVHGYNTSQIDMLDRHAAIEAGLKKQGFKGVVVSYDWPSNGNKLHYNSDLRDANTTSRFLIEDGVLPLIGHAWKPRVHILAHSMGAFMVTKGMAQFGDNAMGGSKPWEMGKVVFASGDAHRRLYRKGAGASVVLERRTKGLVNFNNADDAVLSLAVAFHGKKRVGINGLPSPTEKEHKNISGTAQYRATKPPFSNNNDELLYSHRWWFQSDWFFKRLKATIKP